MAPSRRAVLTKGAALFATAGLAGCAEIGGTTDGTDGGSAPEHDASFAVAAEWNVMRARIRDAVTLGRAGAAGKGADVAQNVFARFEGATGEYGAHEMLEETDETAYEEFEAALGTLRTAGLDAGDVGRAHEAADTATSHLETVQQSLVDDAAANAFALQRLALSIDDASYLVDIEAFEAARTVAENARERFEGSSAQSALEDADGAILDTVESGLDGVVTAASSGNAEQSTTNADLAIQAAIEGSYAVAESDVAAGVGEIAVAQARGWDGATLAAMGGPSTGIAHAATLTGSRARITDATWLGARGETDRAATVVEDVFAHFEGARAHDALESADGEAYEGFESGLEELQSAIEEGNAGAIEDAAATVDSNLVAGIGALAGSNAPLVEAAFFRARLADARERYRLGEPAEAASIAQGLFERFEGNELDFHETVESVSEDLYHRFEEEHLAGVIEAFEAEDDEAVRTHYEGVQATLLAFATTAGGTAAVSAAESAFVSARAFDAAVLATLGEADRAATIAQGVFEHFEGNPGGYHEALEHADAETYEAFEESIGAVIEAADGGEDVYAPAKNFNAEVIASAYAVVESAGGPQREVAVAVAEDAFGSFEEARVHELLEESDHNAYETFEGHLEAFITALDEGGDVQGTAASFADAALYAQFALVDAVEDVPLNLDLAGSSVGSAGGGGGGESGGSETQYQGGPNVAEGVPGDVDHVVDMTAAAFEPAELTVETGDTVAWEFVGGEPHTVTALDEGIPENAEYWASGAFENEAAAREGWENGVGAVQSGESYVHTFETTGEHEYVCIPHELVGMTGIVVVE
ncbi:DUF5059 domain-containing protein [Halorhabdus amylolytica]|uniref:DUF5059 domain-containing protein n=1 Tax=Halorhabdus amylolytica TaxID=2559573 RepID=UPI0010AA9167|nr:DUF5059 domain-containing protein [Halorhabdus amylolytica]